MKLKFNKKIYRKLLILAIAITVLLGIVIAFISPIAKYLVEKYDEKLTGRQITMDWVYVNPFTGYVHISNLEIRELKSDSIFFTADGVTANMAMFKLLSKKYEISKITLDHPVGIIIQNKKEFNFNDLIKKFSSKDSTPRKGGPVHFNILGIKIIEGQFFYREKITPINYSIRKVNIESEGKRWDADTIAAVFSFLSDTGSGTVKGNFTINVKNNDYRFAALVQKFDLRIIQQYLKDLTNFGNFSANLDADLKATGNFLDGENINTNGMLAINELHLGIDKTEDYASFDKLTFSIIELSPKNKKYLFDSISLSHPYLKYEKYDYLDNMQRMFGKEGANIANVDANPAKFNLIIELGKYVKTLSKNFFRSNYKINRIAIYQGQLKVNDYSISEKFSINLSPINVLADSISKNHNRVEGSFTAGIQPYGRAKVTLSINPLDSTDFDFYYSIQKVPASMFNPYLVSMTSFPLDRGTIELNGTWHVRNSLIQSQNHMTVIDPRISNRVRNDDLEWLPMPLILAVVRERGNVIDYEVPITGSLKDPKFHLRDVIFDLVENIFVKPVNSRYIIKVRNIERAIEKSHELKWAMVESEFEPNQEKFIERIVEYLQKNPKAVIAVKPQIYIAKEEELILLYEAKKKYFLTINKRSDQSFSEDDKKEVEKMSIKDTMFVKYLDQHVEGSMLFTIQDKCALLINAGTVNSKLKQLNKQRMNTFMNYFKEGNVQSQIRFLEAKEVIPYNGFSFYEINYHGEMPESLLKAYSQMNDLDEKAPRKRFKRERRKNKNK